MLTGHIWQKLRGDPKKSANVLEDFNGMFFEILVEPDPHVPPKAFQIPADLLRVEAELQKRVVDAEMPGPVAQMALDVLAKTPTNGAVSDAIEILGECPIGRVTKHHQDLGVRNSLSDPVRCCRRPQITNARFAQS
jgi:hypothetical protein